jgi:hypothetical protein
MALSPWRLTTRHLKVLSVVALGTESLGWAMAKGAPYELFERDNVFAVGQHDAADCDLCPLADDLSDLRRVFAWLRALLRLALPAQSPAFAPARRPDPSPLTICSTAFDC